MLPVPNDRRPPFDEVLGFVRRYVYWLAAPALGVALVFAAGTFVKSRTYTSIATFVPQSQSRSSGLASLAAQFSLPVSATDASQSPQFYVDLVQSPSFMRSLAATSLPAATISDRSLADVLDVDPAPPRVRVERTASVLAKHTIAVSSPKTGIVTVGATMRDPRIAYELTSEIIAAINRFNVETRRSSAVAEREFTEGRVKEARADLNSAEDKLQQFMNGNQQFRGSSRLAVENDRLARDVASKQAVYTTLLQSYDQAKIDELRDTPVITIIAQPYLPALPDPRGTGRLAFVGFVLGLFLGLSAALIHHYKELLSGEIGIAPLPARQPAPSLDSTHT